MPYYATSQEWLEQSRLLLEARPSTTRITTKYSIKPVPSPRPDKPAATAAAPRGSLVLKTFDPASGVTLKYRTTKAAEVSRLIYASLGRLGRGMAAVPEPGPDETMTDAQQTQVSGAEGAGEGAGEQKGTPAAQPQQGGGKRKKKGKK